MNYLITMFGDFQDSDRVRAINICLAPMVSSKNLKLSKSDSFIISHFESEWDIDYITSYIKDVLNNQVDMVIVSPSENVTILANNDFVGNLEDLEQEIENSNVQSDTVKVHSGFEKLQQEIMDMMEEDDDDDEDEIKTIIQKSKKNTLSLDDLLDKITEYGFNSLTENEKTLLQKLSK
jgi:transcriptional regulator with AAA-type ATPase domain